MLTVVNLTAQDLEVPWGDVPDNIPKWRSVTSILMRPWFRRVWVIQETALASATEAPVIICGSHQLYWDVIGRAVYWLSNSMYYRDTSGTSQLGFLGLCCANMIRFMRLASSSNSVEVRDRSLQLTLLLEISSAFTSSLPIDMLFALYGLALDNIGPDGRLILIPDYTKSLRQILCEVARHLIDRARHITVVLRSVYHSQRRMSGLPSWVPDWTENHGYAKLDPGNTIFRASLYEQPAPPRWLDPHILPVDAIFVDRIATVGPPPLLQTMHFNKEGVMDTAPSHTMEELKPSIVSQWRALEDIPHQYPNGEDRFDAYWRTLCGSMAVAGARLTPHHQCHFLALWNSCYESKEGERDYRQCINACEECLVADAGLFFPAAHTYASRRFITTACTLMGVAPPSTVVGDEVYVLRGAHTPFILRPAKSSLSTEASSPKQFTLVGEAYVHAVMQGEVLDQHRGLDGSIDWQFIEIL